MERSAIACLRGQNILYRMEFSLLSVKQNMSRKKSFSKSQAKTDLISRLVDQSNFIEMNVPRCRLSNKK